ncbi:hypothetical protein ACFQJD_10690 [Haloplanus sp. GCM10025708]|uniref:hypothetical protein n=1 Tax=Haloplanus sp. GCM10025708 TaxID=3252679 RepID=UPI00361A4006
MGTLTEKKPLPTPDDVSNETAARSFVETHERRYVYNELVDGFGTTQPATKITVESTDAAVGYTTAGGYYLLSTCRGSARYYDPDGSPSRAGRNAASVAHFVGSDVHRRIPFNAYRCEEPVVTESDEGVADRRHGSRSTISKPRRTTTSRIGVVTRWTSASPTPMGNPYWIETTEPRSR